MSGETPFSRSGSGNPRETEIAGHARLTAGFKLDVSFADGHFAVEGAEPLNGDQITIEADLWEDPSGILVRAYIEDSSIPF